MTKRAKKLLVAACSAVLLASFAGTATAGPVEDFCDRSPRDGKAVWYRIICE